VQRKRGEPGEGSAPVSEATVDGRRLTYVNLVLMAKAKNGRWLSVLEAARALGLSRTAVYNAIAEGRLKSHKMVLPKPVVRINAQEVKEFEVSKSH
jgi:excisionase family DNA binding protein